MTLALETPIADLGSLKRHSLVGLLAVFGVFGGLVLWAANTDIAGAVISGGTLVVESYPKQIQHQDGGTVREIFVHNEDAVTEGQVLIRLDDTAIRASLGVINAQLYEGLAQEARLAAQVAGEPDFEVPADLEPLAGDPQVASFLGTQRQILSAQLADRDGRIGQLNEQVLQLDHQIEGLAMQQEAAEKQLKIISARMVDMDDLFSRQLAQAGEVSTLHLQQAAAEGETGRLIAAIAQTRATIAEKRLQIEQINTDFLSQALDGLQKVRQAVAEGRQQKLAAADRLARTDIRAPQAGIVHASVVHTVGGVVSPGETLMQIVPQTDDLLVAIRIDPSDIDQVRIDQKVNLRFSGFDRGKTPELWGKMETISPDFVQEQQTGRRYYTANVRIDADQLTTLPADIKLLPGMPVEAFVTTGDRSVLSYLLHPFTEELQMAFREP
ncbi:MAG: HlyD family type I secretion periplasmic adaptor subunit [Devosia nanyangense]|uniref:Membrane fusion protein (MFP) family protein n=1 Tax=Devosia nanyangense TaxID=1228055 RepID=A0A933NVQ1_9HYPH|nr:HlyD family type I secretion periplasmic adaptor subunit [Devosia nanyangense]